MTNMFLSAKKFNADISKWDVSRVTHMTGMFSEAKSFNVDISKWDVSKVINMNMMFMDAVAFKQRLCGAAWVNSKATQNAMFLDSPGSILRTECPPSAMPAITTSSVFSLQSRSELESAINACLKLSPKGDCTDSTHGPIGCLLYTSPSPRD